MYIRMIKGAMFRQKKKLIMVAFTIALGVSLATAMLNIMFDVGDKINQELKTYGANINVVPKGAQLFSELYGSDTIGDMPSRYLDEEDVYKIKTIFWAYNILDFAPYLEGTAVDAASNDPIPLAGTWFDQEFKAPTGELVQTGIAHLRNWWDLEGKWIDDSDPEGVLVGRTLAEQRGYTLGDRLSVSKNGQRQDWTIKGIFYAGSEEDSKFFIPMKRAQGLLNLDNRISSLEVSALTTPDNDLARQAARNPDSLSLQDWETWYCTAYVSSISYQIEEVMKESSAKPVRQVADSEGVILDKTQLIMTLITLLSLLGSALAISNLVTARVMERSREIALLKAVGADDGPIIGLVISEILLAGAAGGIIGYFAGLGFSNFIGQSVFGSSIEVRPGVIPLVVVLVMAVTCVGSFPAIRRILSLRPAIVLHGRT